MACLREPAPEPGTFISAAPGIGRIVAANPGAMTYHGTNTWLLQSNNEFYIIDPGPNIDAHLAALRAALAGRLTAILLTHRHADHAAAAPLLAAIFGAPIAAFAGATDIPLADGTQLGPFTAWHTPGHAADHLCFALADGTVFTGDHVMGWSTSVIPPPPEGDMSAYMRSLARLRGQGFRAFLPGHGPAIGAPDAWLGRLLAHRERRESAILACLAKAPLIEAQLARLMYPALAPDLARPAAMTLNAHLLKLQAEGRVVCNDGLWIATTKAPHP